MKYLLILFIGALCVTVVHAQDTLRTSLKKISQPVSIADTTEVEEDTVIISATRLSRSINNTSTRIEVISGEELTEKGNMKPGDIRMILNESTGIQTQQTSATSYNAGIRIQGLEGRYTQLLRDGYPLYAGFAGGLSLLQIAPLDLKQVEVIKGAASTLYGGGAIAGIVNLVSKIPGNEPEYKFLSNFTSARGIDISGFYGEKYGKVGITVFGSRNSNAPFDPAAIGFTAIPKFDRYTINPRLFLYHAKTIADFGISFIGEKRLGGSIQYIKNGGNGFFESNRSNRITTQFGLTHTLNAATKLTFKNSISRFERLLAIPFYSFDANQLSTFSELTVNHTREKSQFVFGSSLVMENFTEQRQLTFPVRDFYYRTIGLFIQHLWDLDDKVTLESGLRGDYINQFGFELLPRLSLLIRPSNKLSTRVGGGFGYKPPSLFTEEAERRQFQNILPIDLLNSKNERSLGFNWDINFSTMIGGVNFSINQLFYFTRLNRPLVLTGSSGNTFSFVNGDGYLNTKGMETNIRFVIDDFKLFIGYTYTDATTHLSGVKSPLPLTARHRLNNVLMYEIEGKLKIGVEAYYFSKQRLSDGSNGRSYWITGLMAEKLWEKFSLFINFENFSDTRQTKFSSIYTGSINNPVFRDIYAPLDGFVVNGGIKLSF